MNEWHVKCSACSAVGTYDGLVARPANLDADPYCRSCGESCFAIDTVEGPAPVGSMWTVGSYQ